MNYNNEKEEINLSGFCDVQKDIWNKYTSQIKDIECWTCSEKKLKMISKWQCLCLGCNSKHKIKKPKNFPKNMDDKRNWKSKCDECGGIMNYHETSLRMAYICTKCSNILEV